MSTKCLVTIIIPVYNVEKYLRICLDSVRYQTYNNLQIILIDDGSDDNSSAICDEYAVIDSRFEVIHKENGGQAAARNLALKYVKGDYVLYVDSDDYLVANHVELLVDVAIKNNADIVNCSNSKFFDGAVLPENYKGSHSVRDFSKEAALQNLLYQRIFTQGPVCKLIKKGIAVSTPFPENIIYEDMATVYRWFNKCNIISYLDATLYYYRQRPGSTMRQAFSSRKFDRILVTSEMKSFIESNYSVLQEAMNNRWLLSNLQVLMEIPLTSQYTVKRKELYKNIKEVRSKVIKDKESKKSIRIMALSTYLGSFFTVVEGRLYNKIINK